MWLLRHLSTVSGFAVRLYYRASKAGAPVPGSGPVLLVCNHPNSLLDPACVAWAAGRPVRFLAKAPLFSNAMVGWIVRGSGAIPVYRRQDDPALMRQNEAMFGAVQDALRGGSAVALFPEGTSHSEPAIVPLRTGAARIALGAAVHAGEQFPIVPLGLVFRDKTRFRSEAHIVVGAPIEWSDLAGRAESDQAAVRLLTDRINAAMRAITLNLARWEDAPVLRTAEAIWATARRADDSPAARVARLAAASEILARLRARSDARWETLARDVKDHGRVLRTLGMRPIDVEVDTTLGAAVRWTVHRARATALLQLLIAVPCVIFFWAPYRVVGVLANAWSPERDTLATYRVLIGAAVFPLWCLMVAAAAGFIWGWWAGLGTLAVLPIAGVVGVRAIENVRWTILTVRRWMILRRRSDSRIASLRSRQAELARRLDEALADYASFFRS
jgi:glycerol-3-phosphate O-acyltransferase/dihydroxyacetone phosphate acyltransferase